MTHIPRKNVYPLIQMSKRKDKTEEREMEICALYMVESVTSFLEEEQVPIVQRGEYPVHEPTHFQENEEVMLFSMIPTRVEERMDNTN